MIGHRHAYIHISIGKNVKNKFHLSKLDKKKPRLTGSMHYNIKWFNDMAQLV